MIYSKQHKVISVSEKAHPLLLSYLQQKGMKMRRVKRSITHRIKYRGKIIPMTQFTTLHAQGFFSFITRRSPLRI